MENCPKIFLSKTFCPKMPHLWLKTPILGKFGDIIEIVSTDNLLRWKFATLCSEATFLSPDDAVV